MRTKDRIKRYLTISSMLVLLLITTVISTYAADITEQHKLGEITHYNGLLFNSFRAQRADVEGAIAVGQHGHFGWSADHGFDVGPAIGSSVYNGQYTFIGSQTNPNGWPSLLMGGTTKVGADNGESGDLWYNIYGGDFVIQESAYSAYNAQSPKFSVNNGFKTKTVADGVVAEWFDEAKAKTVKLSQILDNANDVYLTAARLKSKSYIQDKWQNEKDRMVPVNIDTSMLGNDVNIYVINILEGDGQLNLGEIYLPRPGDKDLIIVNVPNVRSVNFTGGAIYGFNGNTTTMLDTKPPGWYPNENKELAQYCDRYIWNFPDAQMISFSSYTMVGSVIAPYAEVYGNGGSINGMLIADSFDSTNGCELHAFSLYKRIFELEEKEGKEPTGSVRLVKYQVETITNDAIAVPGPDAPIEILTTLAGVEFDLQKKADNGPYYDYLTGLVTDAAGELRVEELKSGDYRFVEKTPPGYEPGGSIEFTIDADSDDEAEVHVQLDVFNKLKTVDYELSKRDTADNTGLSGAQFHLYKVLDDESLRYISDVESGENGEIKLKSLTMGRYSLVEFKAPDGYEIDPQNRIWYIDVKLDSNGELIPSLGSNNNDKVFNDPTNPDPSRETIVVEIRKLDALTGDPVPGHLMENAEFYLYKYDDGTWKPTLGVSGGKYTNEEDIGSEKLVITDYGYMVELDEGFYILQEKKPPLGYGGLTLGASGDFVLDGSITEVYLWVPKISLGLSASLPGNVPDKFPQTVFDAQNNRAGYIVVHNEKYSYTIYNQPNGKIEIKKQDERGTDLEGAEFSLFRRGDRGYQFINTARSGADGVAAFENLPFGVYYVIETKAPAGYLIDPTPQVVILDEGGSNQKTITMPNYQQGDGAKARAAFQKVDTDGNPVPGEAMVGAEFDLYVYQRDRMEHNNAWIPVDTLKVENPNATLLVTPPLDPGIYKLVETVPPAGYDNQTMFGDLEVIFPIIVEEENAAMDSINYLGVIEVENPKGTPSSARGKLQLLKIDDVTEEPLPGAQFTLLYTKDKDAAPPQVKGVYTTSDPEGTIKLEDLAPGYYIGYESKAPDGYEITQKLMTPLEFTVGSDGKIEFHWTYQDPVYNVGDDGTYFIKARNEKGDGPDNPEPPTEPGNERDRSRDKDPGTDEPDEYPNDRETPPQPEPEEPELSKYHEPEPPDQPLDSMDNPETGDMVTRITFILLAYLLSSAVVITYLYRMDETS